MTKEAKSFWAGALLPLILAAAAWINAHAHKVEAEAVRAEKLDLSDDFQAYIEYVMEQRGCDP